MRDICSHWNRLIESILIALVDSNEYTQHTSINIENENHPKLSKNIRNAIMSAEMGLFLSPDSSTSLK